MPKCHRLPTWLTEKELKECIDILKENKITISSLDHIQYFSSANKKVELIQTQTDFVAALGEEIYYRTQEVLTMSTDIDTVMFRLHAEDEYLFFLES